MRWATRPSLSPALESVREKSIEQNMIMFSDCMDLRKIEQIERKHVLSKMALLWKCLTKQLQSWTKLLIKSVEILGICIQ